MKHRATGNPRGRPRKYPADLYKQVFEALKGHVDPETGLVKVTWTSFANELGISRSTLARQMMLLRYCKFIESVKVPIGDNQIEIHYRLKELTGATDAPVAPSGCTASHPRS